MTPGKKGILRDPEFCRGIAHEEALDHAQTKVEPKVAAAHAVERAACEVGELEAAAFALVGLDDAALAVAHHVETAATGAHGDMGH